MSLFQWNLKFALYIQVKMCGCIPIWLHRNCKVGHKTIKTQSAQKLFGNPIFCFSNCIFSKQTRNAPSCWNDNQCLWTILTFLLTSAGFVVISTNLMRNLSSLFTFSYATEKMLHTFATAHLILSKIIMVVALLVVLVGHNVSGLTSLLLGSHAFGLTFATQLLKLSWIQVLNKILGYLGIEPVLKLARRCYRRMNISFGKAKQLPRRASSEFGFERLSESDNI